MKSIYLAGPFFDNEQLNRIQEVEKALYQNNTVKEVFSPRKIKILEKSGSEKWASKIFKLDIEALNNSDVVLAIIDFDSHYVDSGTAFEIGYAFSHKKPLVILHTKDNIVNLMISNSLIAYLTSISEVKKYNFDLLKSVYYKGPLI